MNRNGLAGQLLRVWWEDYHAQTLMSAAASFGCTALFALYNGYLGLCCGSVWHGSIGVFYLLLMAVRGMILRTEHRNRSRDAAEQGRCRRRTFRVSSALLLALDLALMLPIAMMVVLDKPVSMGLIPATAMVAYTTWKITMASLHIRRQRRRSGGNSMLPVSAASSAVIYGGSWASPFGCCTGDGRDAPEPYAAAIPGGRPIPCTKAGTCAIIGSTVPFRREWSPETKP